MLNTEKLITKENEEKAAQEIIDVVKKYGLTISIFKRVIQKVLSTFFDNATL
ncbi:hypothetical protein J5E42_04175 [Mammaliicoccus vitulinus]|uniref:hypothetical protein n=1 Tax=Mammaliicoccus vitulinus TaxID=71237 RepID=UPI001AAC55A8|nr:hypothetical protein [Mammaliicoccus vitulinus]MBO3076708.1 hypothetical protein [Mammaliicoccus vitulinus]